MTSNKSLCRFLFLVIGIGSLLLAYGSVVNAADPDLIVSDLTVLSITEDSIRYHYVIKNVGTGWADLNGPTGSNADNVSVQATLSYYQTLGSTMEYPAETTIVGKEPVAQLPPIAGGLSGIFHATLPAVPPAPPYLILKVDVNNVLEESDETNNTKAVVTQLLRPDLVVSELRILSHYADMVKYEYRILNVGGGPANLYGLTDSSSDNVGVKAMWSADEVYDYPGDQPAGGTRLSGSQSEQLLPNHGLYRLTATGLPSDPPAHPYLIVKVDTSNELQESDETNNTSAVRFDCVPKTCIELAHCGAGISDGCGGFLDCPCNDPSPDSFLTLHWQSVVGASSYDLELEVNEANIHRIRRTGAASASVDDFGVTFSPGSTYRLRVRALDSAGLPGAWSPWRSISDGFDLRRPSCSTVPPGGVQFEVTYDYDDLGRIKYFDHPTSSSLRQEYTYAVGAGPKSVQYDGTPVATDGRYTVGGTLSSFTYTAVGGSQPFAGGTLNRTPDPLGRMDTTTAQVGGANHYSFDVDYNVAGRVEYIRRQFAAGVTTFHYTYGDYGELGSYEVSGAGGNGTVTYQYDPYGNLESRTGLSTATLLVPAQPSTTFNRFNRNTSFNYDDAGRVVHTGTLGIGYNALDQISHVHNDAGTTIAAFLYSGNGERVRSDYEQLTRYSIRDLDNRIVSHVDYEPTPQGCWEQAREIDYVYFDNGVLMSNVKEGGSDKRRYFIRDFLGSPTVVFDQDSGFTPEEYAYSPYGYQMVRASGGAGAFEFVGYERDSETNLDYAHARYYDRAGGRFLTPDPARDFNQTNPFSFNLYQYARANPLLYRDPSGSCAIRGDYTLDCSGSAAARARALSQKIGYSWDNDEYVGVAVGSVLYVVGGTADWAANLFLDLTLGFAWNVGMDYGGGFYEGDFDRALSGAVGALLIGVGGRFAQGPKAAAPASSAAPKLLGQGVRGFASGELAIQHFGKHGSSVMRTLGQRSYNLVNYLDDANHVIRSGQWVPELNGYVKLLGGQGSAEAAFVGINRATGNITTFHIKTVEWLSRRAPSLGWIQ